MRVVADRTILSGRLMLNQERSPFFSMALIAGLVDGMFFQLRGASRAVRIVTIGTDHLAFSYRMARTPIHLGTLVLVTGETDLDLSGLGENRIFHAHYIVAVCACITRGSMRTHLPI